MLSLRLQQCRRRRRKAGVVDPPMGVRLCPGDGQPCHRHAAAGTCGMFGDAPPPEPPAASPINVELAHKLWRMLHTATDADAAWVEQFTRHVPCGECKKHWRALLKETPPVFGAGWFAWTVTAHNAVNAALGKPPMSLDEARALYFGAQPIE